MPSASSSSLFVGVRLECGDRLRHPAEDDPRPFAFERDRDDALAGLEPDLGQLERRGEDERGPERGMPRERDLLGRREYANARVPSLSAGRTKTVSDRFVSRASCCIRSVSTPLPSVKTATGLPASGVSVKTSQMTYRRST